jgi:Xaa-Pro aminopeptidase
MTASSPSRLTRLRQRMQEAELPALLVSQPESRRYLSGYGAKDIPQRESAGVLLVTEDRQLILTDPRTAAAAAAEAPAFELRVYRSGAPMPEALREAAAEAGVRAIGFDPNHLPYATWRELSDALDGIAELMAAPDLVDRLRMVKDPDEIETLRASIDLNEAAFAHLARTVQPGITERALAWEMENFVRTHGGEGVSFDPITVGGPNSAIPHAQPSDRAIRADELVLFDIGALLHGYCSDMTRTVCIESVPDELENVWKVVVEAQAQAEARANPGMTGAEVDAIARGVIREAGYGDQFVHGTGHGVGLEIHEPPWITPTRGVDVLEPGMVFSIEPGVYLPGIGGVRMEDLLLLTENGAEVLSTSPKKLYLSEVLVDLDR